MKSLMTLILILFSLSAMAQDRQLINQLLLDKGTTLERLEAQGMRLVMGERTGGGRSLRFASVEVLFTREEAILKREIQNVSPQQGANLGSLESVQAGGRHIDADDIIGVLSK